MELHEYTDQQIKAEYKRRRRKQNANWYFIPYDYDPDPEWRSDTPEFVIINRRAWHLTKLPQCTPIKHHVKLPPKFREKGASHFVYKKYGVVPKKPVSDPAKLLEEYQFVRLDVPLDPDLYTVIQTFNAPSTAFDKWQLTAHWVCDTPELKKVVEDWVKTQSNATYGLTREDAFNELIEEATKLADKHGCVAYPYDLFTKQVRIAFLKKEVFESLPPHPYKLKPGREIP